MRFISTLAALLLSGCAVFGSSQQPCKVVDPDLAQGVYRGGCKDGWADGYGEVDAVENSGSVSSYRGGFLAGKKHGKGIKVMPNGDRYEGDFSDDHRHGKGVYVWGDSTPWAGDRYQGEYRRDLRHGWGIFQWGNGDRYEGPWQDDLRRGKSVMEQRRAQAAEAAAKAVQPGAPVCIVEPAEMDNFQRILGKVESVTDGRVRVRIVAFQGEAAYQGKALKPGDVLEDEAAHWQFCGKN